MTCPHALLVAAIGQCPVCPAIKPFSTIDFSPVLGAGDSDISLSPEGLITISDCDKTRPSADSLVPEFPDLIIGNGISSDFSHKGDLAEVRIDSQRKSEMLVEAETLKRRLVAQDARILLAYRSLGHFVRQGWHVLEPGIDLEWNWHHHAICIHVQGVLTDWIKRQRNPDFKQRAQNLLINVPPGTMKSRILVYAIAWMWLRWPSWTVKCLSSSPRVAIRDADYTRQLVGSKWYREEFVEWLIDPNTDKPWDIRNDRDAVTNFENTCKGSRTAMGFNGKITGERADALFVDDPHDADEVHSEVQRESVIDRWDRAIWNRVNDLRASVRIGIMQRLHEGDWSGHVLRQAGIDGAPKWCALILPMEFEPDRRCTTVFGWSDPRKQGGEVLHPSRFTPEILAQERIRLGSLGYAGQYQQRPAPAEGGMFKRQWFRFFRFSDQPIGDHPRPAGCVSEPPLIVERRHDGMPDFDWMCLSVDCAFKKTDDGSRVGLLVIAGKGARRFVVHDGTRAMTFTETIDAIKGTASAYPGATRKLIELKANGDAVVNSLQATVPGIIGIEPEGGKESRAAAVSPIVEALQVFLLDGAPWLEAFVYEICVFNAGTHDDRVDALTQALNHYGMSPDAMRALALLTL